jgi:hypothetical protein
MDVESRGNQPQIINTKKNCHQVKVKPEQTPKFGQDELARMKREATC